jgi:hypothetical protein
MNFLTLSGTVVDGLHATFAVPTGYVFAGVLPYGAVLAVSSSGAVASTVHRFSPSIVPSGVTTVLAVSEHLGMVFAT